MTLLATVAPGGQGLALADSDFQLGESEPLAVGVKRVTMVELERAATGFFDAGVPLGLAVHQSRKSIKRVRALLRLVRGDLTKKVFDFENTSLRAIAWSLSDVRSAQGVVEAADVISELYVDLLAEGTFGDMIERLRRRRDLTEMRAEEDPNLVGRVVRGLERAYNRYSSWPTEPDARRAYGMGVRDGYGAVQPGLSKTYARGRHDMVRAYGRSHVDGFHEWRKRVKDLRHQMEFLTPLWPEGITGIAQTLERLGDLLGEDHDLVELSGLLVESPRLCADPRERSLFQALVDHRRAELQVACEILGRRIYAEKPAALTHRFGEYWESRAQAIESTLDTVVVY